MKSPGVRFPPPILFVLGFGLAWLLETRIRRVPLTGSPPPDILATSGWMLIVAGILLTAWGMLTFARARTGIIPNHPASQIVDVGPYRFTRNPMYVGFTLAYVGGALLLNTGWPFVTLPLSLWALTHFVIAREERYLTEAFGDVYTNYQRRVRRWL